MPGETSATGSIASTSGQVKKTTRSRQNKVPGLLGAKFFDNKIPLKKKV